MSALIFLGFTAAIGIPVWLGMRAYDEEMAKLAKGRVMRDQMAILQVEEEFRRRDRRYASLNAGSHN